MQNEDEKLEVENPGEDADRWQELKRPPSKDASLADKIKWLVTTIIVIASAAFVIFGLTGCATPRESIMARTELAVRAQMQLDQAADEADLMAKKLLELETDKVLAANKIDYENNMMRASTPEQGAAVGFEYARRLSEIQASKEAEARRLAQVGEKIRLGGQAALVLNRMADRQAQSYEDLEQIIYDQALPAAIQVVGEVQKYYERKEAEEAERLRREADKPKEEPHHEEPAPEPTPTPIPTPENNG